MRSLALLATFCASAVAHGNDLTHEHPGGVFQGAPKVGCNAPNLSSGEPSGTIQNLTSSLQAYITTPKQRKKPSSAVIYLSDIFGLPLVNNKLLADAIAAAGFHVVFPDLFAGDAVPVDAMGSPSWNMTAWRERHPVSAIDAIVTATVQAVRSELGYEDIGAVGYCFGGKYVARFLAEGKGLNAGFVAHPSGLTEAELEAIVNPLSIAYAGKRCPLFPFGDCEPRR
jgi:dienelactone hydrolase